MTARLHLPHPHIADRFIEHIGEGFWAGMFHHGRSITPDGHDWDDWHYARAHAQRSALCPLPRRGGTVTVSSELTKKQRWTVADRVNEVPTSCWADLVDWALRGWSEVEIEETGDVTRSPDPIVNGGGWCALQAPRDGGCWCGKFRTGLEVTDGRA